MREGCVLLKGGQSSRDNMRKREREGALINFKPVTPPPVCQFHFGLFLCSDFSVTVLIALSYYTREYRYICVTECCTGAFIKFSIFLPTFKEALKALYYRLLFQKLCVCLFFVCVRFELGP